MRRLLAQLLLLQAFGVGLVHAKEHLLEVVVAAPYLEMRSGPGRGYPVVYVVGRDEVVTVLAEQAPDLHDALELVAAQGWSHVVLDGKVFRTDRCAETTTSAKGETINAWYSGKHRAPGGNVQALMRPDGLPIWTSDVLPGHRHDLTCARTTGVLGALYWSASQLDLPTLADSGYEGAGHGVYTPIKQPGRGQVLAPDNQTYNTLLRSVRCRGERGFALLTGRWKALRRITASPRRIGDYVKAALVLTLIEQVDLRTSC